MNFGCPRADAELMQACVMPTIDRALDFDGVKALEQLQSMVC